MAALVTVLALLALLGLALSVRIVQQYEKGVLFRLGRVIDVREPDPPPPHGPRHRDGFQLQRRTCHASRLTLPPGRPDSVAPVSHPHRSRRVHRFGGASRSETNGAPHVDTA
jgi:hypothetical protein